MCVFLSGGKLSHFVLDNGLLTFFMNILGLMVRDYVHSLKWKINKDYKGVACFVKHKLPFLHGSRKVKVSIFP